jgi:hypothetical protein
MLRRDRKIFAMTLTALLCIAGSLIVFFSLTYPANQVTNNWTTLPANWLELRFQWEDRTRSAQFYICLLLSCSYYPC